MPVAPRYSPDGVRIGSMPVPQVRPQTGTADALASVGQTIAGLGQTIDRVQARQEQRANDAEREKAFAAAAAKAQRDADQTAGNSLFLDWEAQEDARNAEYRTTNGRLAIDKYTGYTESVTKSIDGFVEGKELSQGAIDYFKQKATRNLRKYGSLAHTHLQTENTKYVTATEGRILESSVNQASFALAGDDQEGAAMAFTDAMASAERLAGVTGIPADLNKIASDSYYGAMERLDKAERPDKALEFYQKNAGKFGNRQGDAEVMARHSADKVFLGTMSQVADIRGRDQYGNFDITKAEQAVNEAAGKIDNPILKPNAERAKDVNDALKRIAAEDAARRSAIGDEAHNIVSQKFLEPYGQRKVQAWMETPYIRQTVLGRMNDTDYARLMERVANGPTHNNSTDAQRIEAMLADGGVSPDAIQKSLAGAVLSNERRATYAKQLQNREESRGKAEWDAVEMLWKIQERIDPTLRKVAYSDKMDESEAQRLIDTNKAFTQIVQGLVKEKRPLSVKELEDAFNQYAMKAELASGGDKTGKRVMDITAEDAASVTPQQIQKARDSLPPSAPDGAVYNKAIKLQQDWNNKIRKTEEALQKQANTDTLDAILQDARAAKTFADIDAVRQRYGAYARGKTAQDGIAEMPLFIEHRTTELRGK